ncbi:uncharacterized protein Z519_03043 [Cladophialophora bantiana CBS 173.52]|uniref:PNPLA domain-containing protein n=1 Tax=Cladophialophora bantiana (strain ATCC 10958 / CBS 173.52 / CDC B-1940 / NIH 8579) TaxID=1442370 RepID=A0A0D2GBS3_CLAB1|nr:uncharacterized protein Z519_03043 [Cladophialophora bantiana CBS 173.52]KIW95977.1 hypothetical protein Z519_03043 [Cladophialophora bantiana CBS 173.52]
MSSNGDPSRIPPPKSGSTDAYNILALDGGGVKGISSVIILDKIANTEKGKPTDLRDRKPVDYFDLAAGTSTGGLIALMLFRLEMNCPDVIAQYENLAKEVFQPMLGKIPLNSLGSFGNWIGDIWLKLKAVVGRSQFSHQPLEKAIDAVVGGFPLDDDDRARKGDAVLVKSSQGQMFMCATLADRGESVLLRNYEPPFAPLPVSTGARTLDFKAITIKEAARATSAAPTYLKEATIQNLKFWDGGLLNNNPIVQAWDNRFDLVSRDAPSPQIKCIVSLGTTHPEYDANKRPGSGIMRFFNTITKTVAFVTNTEAKHRDFDRNMRQRNERNPTRRTSYYRFNASTGKDEIDLDDYLKMPKLKEYTDVYLEKPEIAQWVNECAALLAKIN